MSDPTILFLDLETQNNPYFGAIASPRHPENYVVMNGYASESAPFTGAIQCDHYLSKEEVPDVWLKIPESTWLIVMHNAPYEMDWFLHLQRPTIQAYLKRGGRIFCTAYAEYLLSHQLETYPSLNDTAPKYGGSHKVDGIKALWDSGVLTADIDPLLLREYLAGPEGDVENTRKIFYGQYALLQERGMLNMALERMEGLIFNCFAMDAGLYVDREVAFRQRDEQEIALAALTASFDVYRTHIPEYVKFNPGSDFHMSAWLFGGPIKYTGRELATTEDGTQKYVKADAWTDSSGFQHTIDTTADGFDIEVALWDQSPMRYKSGKQKGQIKLVRVDTAEPQMRNCEMTFLLGPLVDLKLLPSNIMKEFSKEFSGKRVLADGSCVYSSSGDCFDMLALRKEFPEHVRTVLKDLQKWASLDKDLGTYYLRQQLDDGGNVVKQSGMLQYLTDQNIVHHMLNATSTITTRLSSTRPNLQNIPRGNTSSVKKMFTSRFGALGCIIEADYSALEVVTLAAFSKDKALTKALLDGIDMHCLRLAGSLGEPYEDVLLKCKDQTHPDFARYDEMRTNIKPKAFQYQYGATAAGIAFSTGCTIEEAQLFIDTEVAMFPEVETFFTETILASAMRTKVMYREQADDGSWQQFGRGHWQAPGGTCYSFRQVEKKSWFKGQCSTSMEFRIPQIRNYGIQGESGFFVQGMGGRIIRWLIANDFFGGRVAVINTVHDAFYLDCMFEVLDVVAAGVQAIMESLPTYFNQVHGYDMQVPFPAAVEFGMSMHQKVHWHPGVLNDPVVREKLGSAILPEIIKESV